MINNMSCSSSSYEYHNEETTLASFLLGDHTQRRLMRDSNSSLVDHQAWLLDILESAEKIVNATEEEMLAMDANYSCRQEHNFNQQRPAMRTHHHDVPTNDENTVTDDDNAADHKEWESNKNP
jgi:DNA gyrase/topoisomerase IV subunit A